ncbi:14119_t:CDS:1, partial [Rhizophagus irregularis]
DILYPIFEELQYDIKSLASCLRVNKTWCEIVIPILWRNPWEHLTFKKKKLLLNIIISHLSDEARTNLNQHFSFISFITKPHKRPLFNYISFCRHLNLEMIEHIVSIHTQYRYRKKIRNNILKLFINKNAKYTHLYMPSYHDDHHLIPGAEQCLSEIKFLRCDGRVHDKNLTMLTKVCKSIKELHLFLYDSNNNYGISKLIENQKSLFGISFLNTYSSHYNNSFCKVLEKSLVKHANTIQYFSTFVQPQTQILTSFVNLKTLILNNCEFDRRRWYFIENVSLPSLQFLDANTINTESLTSLIKNSGEKLTEIRIFNLLAFSNGNYNKKIIQAICQSCLNLMHLELYYIDANVLELEKLLTRCQYLSKLVFHFSSKFCSSNFFQDKFIIDWGNLFNILAASSPSSLFKFTFYFPVNNPELKSLKLFFDTWEGRHPMSLIIFTESNFTNTKNTKKQLDDLINSYKAKGVIKEFVYNFHDDESKATIKGAVKDLVA